LEKRTSCYENAATIYICLPHYNISVSL